MRSTVVFSFGLMIAFGLEGWLTARECAARAPMTAADIAVQVYQHAQLAPNSSEVVPVAATVTLLRSGGTVRTLKTDTRGYARITPPPGRYTVHVTASGANGFGQIVIIGAKGVGTPRVLAIWMPDGFTCPSACEVQSNSALAKPPDCLFALRTTRD